MMQQMTRHALIILGLPLSVAILPGGAAGADTVFVKDGKSQLIRALGCGWEFEKGAIFLMHVHGSRSTLYGGRQVAAGDFRAWARLTVPTAKDRPSLIVSPPPPLDHRRNSCDIITYLFREWGTNPAVLSPSN